MGMYDTINGEQVKCFPWVSFDDDKIINHHGLSYHGGDLKYYNIGDSVPYRKPHYNYGKNFIILDVNEYETLDYRPYDYIIHVIVDGKVKDTFENEIRDIDWSINESVVSYGGRFINIKNSFEISDYIRDILCYKEKYHEIKKHWTELFHESMGYFRGFGTLEKDSEEKKLRKKKLDEIHILMDQEKERIEPEIEHIKEKYLNKWIVDTANIDDLVILGGYIDAANNFYDESHKKAADKVRELLSSSPDLYDRYVEWQGSDEFIKEYKLEE